LLLSNTPMPAPSETLPHVVSDVYPGIAPEKYAGTNKGRVVFITGASRGLGLECAKAFAATGASLFLSARSTDVLQRVKTEISTTHGVPVEVYSLDATIEAQVKAAVDEALRIFGKIDIVVANVGGSVGAFGVIGEVPAELWWQDMELNFKSAFLLATLTIPQLRKTKGYIVFISSEAAHIKLPTGSSYNIAKLAVNRLADWIDVEHGPAGVKAFALQPGAVKTDLSAELLKKMPHLEPLFKNTPQLSAWTQVRLTSGSEDWLSGRYLDSTWNLDELEKYKAQILEADALKARLSLPEGAPAVPGI